MKLKEPFSEKNVHEKARTWAVMFMHRPNEIEAPHYLCEESYKAGYNQHKEDLQKVLDENITYIYRLFEVRKKEIRGGIEPKNGWDTDTVIDELDTTETEVTTKLKKLLALLEGKL